MAGWRGIFAFFFFGRVGGGVEVGLPMQMQMRMRGSVRWMEDGSTASGVLSNR